MVYLGVCLIAGIREAWERQVNVRVVRTGKAIEESVDRIAYTQRHTLCCPHSGVGRAPSTIPLG